MRRTKATLIYAHTKNIRAVQRYMSCYFHQSPEIDLELELSNTVTEFYSSNADFAISVGKQKD